MSQLMLINPRRRKTRRKAISRRAATPLRKRTKRSKRRAAVGYVVGSGPIRRRKLNPRRLRRNPKLSISSIQKTAIMPAAIGGVGALALDVAFGALPIPTSFKTGAIGSLAKLAGAVVLGKIAGKALGSKVGEAVTVGAVTIQAYNLVKGFAQKSMPSLPMGEYLSGDFPPYSNLGYVNAAVNAGDARIAPYSDADSGMGHYISGYDHSGNYAGY